MLKLSANNRGFGLIEVLITLLVFSIGVLSVAGLQAIAKKNNYDALQRTTAANLANAIVTSIRVNANARTSYFVENATPLGESRDPATPNPNCIQAACTPAQLAAFDLRQWDMALDGAHEVIAVSVDQELNTGGLAFPSACINGPAGGGPGFYKVTIVWRGVSRLSNAAANPCGATLGYYGASEDDASDNSYQRAFVLDTYIAP